MSTKDDTINRLTRLLETTDLLGERIAELEQEVLGLANDRSEVAGQLQAQVDSLLFRLARAEGDAEMADALLGGVHRLGGAA